MLTTPEQYLESIEGPGRSWLKVFYDYMDKRHPDVAPVMFRQRPMFKVGKSYVMFTAAARHFSVHTMNFELIDEMKQKLPKADYGKGCVKVRFTDDAAIPALEALVDRVIEQNRRPDAPPVDVTPELPYDEALSRAFAGVRAKWLPLYGALRDAARERLPVFHEYFPAVDVRWKHDTTFAQVSGTAGAMRVEFYQDRPRPELKAVRTQRLSKNRVSHTVELTDESGFEAVLNWLAESYQLTAKK